MKFLSFLFLILILPLVVFSTVAMSKNSQNQMIFIMLGAPGAGKGTQAIRLSDRFGIPQIATGDLFRDHLRNQTELGEKAKSYIDQGQLVPDSLVLDMLFDRLSQSDCSKGYILDGFPRTIPQAESLNDYLTKTHAKIFVISLEVPDAVIIERLSGRLVCERCSAPYHKTANPPQVSGICDRDGGKLIQRKDDSEEIIKERLRVFHEQTEPVKKYFESKNALVIVDGTLSKQATNQQIDSYLENNL